MGVPAFFRWLTRKYPSVVVECREDFAAFEAGTEIDPNEPNPNDVEFDNLYLDMNGIIHPCTHPENKPPPQTEDEMMTAIFECIDRIMAIVRPRKLLYLAIDGVAPRAKMNQQRSRRFRAAKETQEKAEQLETVKAELRARGVEVPPSKKSCNFDSNCITPGTEFMSYLSTCLHFYIMNRLSHTPAWKKLKIILSDASVPGEGEHKIMDFIRRQRALPTHDPNTHHCLCGADADLIMLGLATHEPYFTIIREEFLMNQPRKCEICGQTGHEMKECKGQPNPNPDSLVLPAGPTKYIFVRLSVLREYLEEELQIPNLPFQYDFERALDDWVFMCFFVGNDFLPHLPSLEIRENAIDRLITLYKKTVTRTQGFLTDSGDVNLSRVQLIMNDLGIAEDEIFKKRNRSEIIFRSRNKQKKFQETLSKMMSLPENENKSRSVLELEVEFLMAQEARNEVEPIDEVRLHEQGYKDRYYKLKFNLPRHDIQSRHEIGREYVRGLCWVLKYYYQGCASWKWFYPYHYAPFAADFLDIQLTKTAFERNTLPFSPMEQLMSVFPAASGKLVPVPLASLMTDEFSPILDFYPRDFLVDLNGKKFAWQGVALLPFVDESRLKEALEPYLTLLTQTELDRNTLGYDILYMTQQSDCYSYIADCYSKFCELSVQVSVMEFKLCSKGVSGIIKFPRGLDFKPDSIKSPLQSQAPLEFISAYSCSYKDPIFPPNYKFVARMLKGAKIPPKVLQNKDFKSQTPNNQNSYRKYDPKSAAQNIGGPHAVKRPPSIGFNGGVDSVAFVGEAGSRMIRGGMGSSGATRPVVTFNNQSIRSNRGNHPYVRPFATRTTGPAPFFKRAIYNELAHSSSNSIRYGNHPPRRNRNRRIN